MGRFVIGAAGTGRDDETTWLADPVSAIVGDAVNDRLVAISTTNIETWPLPQP